MENGNNRPRKTHFWSGAFRLHWDRTTMPMVNQDLQITKNEITKQVFLVKNSERAGKVLQGASTDMEDMLKLCNHFGIDICQFMLLPDGSHPVMLHRDDYEKLRRAAMGDGTHTTEEPREEELTPPPATEPASDAGEEEQETVRSLSDANVGMLIDQLKAQGEKIAELYERITELTAQNAVLRSKPGSIYYAPKSIADNNQTPYQEDKC